MFSNWLGKKPARLGIVSTLYDQYTATHLTEALMNTVTREKKNTDSFTSINSFLVEWDLKVNRIHRVPILSVTGDGCNGGDVIFTFPENWYNKHDVFVCERSRQQFMVVNRPQRVADNCFTVIAKIYDNDYNSTVDTSGAYAGATTRFVTNYQPELHEEGYSRFQSKKHCSFA